MVYNNSSLLSNNNNLQLNGFITKPLEFSHESFGEKFYSTKL